MSDIATKPKIETTKIHSRAMLSSLRVSTWTARKYDKRISKEVTDSHHAVQDAGRFNKMLLPGDCPSYKALMTLVGSIRTEYYQNTLPWSDEGWRLLPTANYMHLAGMVRGWQSHWDTLLSDFLAEYPQLREQAKVRLNGMYKEEDYPTVSQIRSKFGLYFDKSPLPAKGDFRCDLPEEELRQIEQETSSRQAEALDSAMTDAWKRLHDCVKHIHERTATPDAIFRDTLIYNARELCDVLSRMNITGNAQFEQFREEIESSLVSNDPDTIRENDSLREDTATLAEDILNRMAGFYQPEEEEITYVTEKLKETN